MNADEVKTTNIDDVEDEAKPASAVELKSESGFEIKPESVVEVQIESDILVSAGSLADVAKSSVSVKKGSSVDVKSGSSANVAKSSISVKGGSSVNVAKSSVDVKPGSSLDVARSSANLKEGSSTNVIKSSVDVKAARSSADVAAGFSIPSTTPAETHSKVEVAAKSSVSIDAKSKLQSQTELSSETDGGPMVQVLYPTKAIVGEGLFYEEQYNQLLWVDIESKTVNFLNLDTNENRVIDCPDMVGAVLAVEGSTDLLIMLGNKLCLIDRNSGEIKKELCSVEEDNLKNRINDAKCDSSGRVWFGTMARKPVYREDSGASLYCYSKHVLKRFNHVILSNGLGWSPTNDILYHVDTYARSIFGYSYDKSTGTITNQSMVIDYAQDDALVLPDGMCTDEDGRLWVASFGGKRVTCWDPRTKSAVMTVEIPGAKNITSCCFGGPNYEWLFVASASILHTEEELTTFPNSGSLFVVKNLGARGLPPHKFKL